MEWMAARFEICYQAAAWIGLILATAVLVLLGKFRKRNHARKQHKE